MRPRGPGCLSALALVCAAPAWGQQQPGLTFAGTLYDVTGACTLDLGDIEPVLQPFERDFRQGRDALGVEVTVDRGGAVIGCRTKASPALAKAGEAICAHALKTGRFRQYPRLVLDYAEATFAFTLRTPREQPPQGTQRFRMATGFPLERISIRFGSDPVPPATERLGLSEIATTRLEYPREALQNGIEAEVVVAATFDAKGEVATCRPVYSSNTPRMAYETCIAVQNGFRLINPSDSRPFYWKTTWMLAD